MSLAFNTFRVPPTLKDLLDVLKRDVFLTLNCHSIGTIQSVTSPNAGTPPFPFVTAQVQINYSKTVQSPDGSQVAFDYPLIADVPLISLCGGTTGLTFPIAVGDQALILFNDRDMDNWMNGARSGQVNSPRLHSFSDAIALVGLNNISSYDTVRALLSNGTVKLGINPESNKVTLTNGTTLLSILQDLVTGILGLTVPAAPGGVVDTTGKVAAASTALGGLLE